MFEEKLDKMAGPKQALPKIAKIKQPASDESLESAANAAITQYTAKATEARHTYGRGVPKTSELLGG